MVEILTTSTVVKSGIARHGRAIASIILFQTLLIVWLSSWVVGDYLNNQYVRAYVDTTFQADTWIIGSLLLVTILGSSIGLVLRKNRHASKTLGIVSTQANLPRPALATSTTKTTAQSAVSSTPSTELHPAVAALKADLSEARLSLGLASVSTGGQRIAAPTGPATKFEDQKPTLLAAPHPPGISIGPQPVLSNPTPTPVFNRPIPPTVIRPMAPPTPGGIVPPRQTLPTLKVEGGTPPTPRPIGLLPRPTESTPPAAKDVSTVITGILPGQQPQEKKKESESTNGKTASQQ